MIKRFLFIFLLLFLVSQGVFANDYCPTPDEIRATMHLFQFRAMKNMDLKVPLEQVEALNNELITYQQAIVPNCVRYFQVTHNPDCNKLISLATGYMLLDNNKQLAARGQILNVTRGFEATCKYQYETVQSFVK